MITSALTDFDLHLFNEGNHTKLYQKLGAHLYPDGAHLAVWAPDASAVTAVGDFNGWDRGSTPLQPRGGSGIWEGSIAGAHKGQTYKFHIRSRSGGYAVDKADPFACFAEVPPKTASVLWDLDYDWGDQD